MLLSVKLFGFDRQKQCSFYRLLMRCAGGVRSSAMIRFCFLFHIAHLDEVFGNLHGIESRSFSDLVTSQP